MPTTTEAHERLAVVRRAASRGEPVKPGALSAAEESVHIAELGAEGDRVTEARKAEEARLDRIDAIGDELASTVLPARAAIDSARADVAEAITRLRTLVEGHNSDLRVATHELSTLCGPGRPPHVHFDMYRLAAHGPHRYAEADLAHELHLALLIGVPNSGFGMLIGGPGGRVL